MTQRPRPLPIATRVARVDQLTPSMVRVVPYGEELDRFADLTDADA